MMQLAASACLVLALSSIIAPAQQNRLPQDEAKAYARACAERAAVLTDAQIKVDVDPDKPCAERGEGGGAMVIPDKRLSEKALSGVGKDVVPLGQLWLRKWTLQVNGKATPDDRLRIVTVNLDDKDRPMPLFLLGVRKGEKDLKLVVYAAGSEPLQVLPLKKLETPTGLPLELEWSRGDKDADNLTLNVLGKHQAVLKIARQEK